MSQVPPRQVYSEPWRVTTARRRIPTSQDATAETAREPRTIEPALRIVHVADVCDAQDGVPAAHEDVAQEGPLCHHRSSTVNSSELPPHQSETAHIGPGFQL